MNINFRELLAYRKSEELIEPVLFDQCFAKSQLKESLVYKGKEVAIECNPLDQYFSQLDTPPQFLSTCKSNKRGYLGKWAIIKNGLYLIEFIGMLDSKEELSLGNLFPDKKVVFAEWFSGEIILNQGKLLALKSEVSQAIYEKDLHLEIKNGHLINTQIIENKPDQLDSYTPYFFSANMPNSALY